MAKAAKEVYLSPAQKAWVTRRNGTPKPAPRPRPKLEPQVKIKLPAEVETVSSNDMILRTVVFSLTFSKIGNRRKIDNALFEFSGEAAGEVDKESVNATKKLIESEELDQINSLYGELSRYVQTRALPSHIKRGVYLLPKVFDDEVNGEVKNCETKVEPIVESLVSKLALLKKEAKQRLGPLYNEDDYPTAAELRAAFNIRARTWKIDSADGLSQERDREEREKTKADWAETRETIKLVMRTQMKEMVDHLVERLSPNEHGEKKSFRENMLPKFSEFLSVFDARNITNDVQMKVLVERAKSLVTKADTELLRNDEVVRDYIRSGFENIKTLLDPMVAKKAHRSIRIED